jgi:lipopolysaccharide export LptBFGC system permease protein LptF
MWRDALRGWRAFALVYFILITVLTAAEALGDVLGFFDLPTYAQFSGIAPEMEFQRLVSLSILSTASAVAAAATAYGILREKSWTVRAGTLCGIVLLLYMMYQILSALFILNVNNFAIIGAGSTYGMFGLLGMWLVRRGARGEK